MIPIGINSTRSSSREGGRLVAKIMLIVLALNLAGCGVMAAPCRITSAALKMVPLVGHVAALPTDACAAVIDP